MLDTLRANSRSILTYVLFGIIIVVFIVSFGPGSRGCTSGNARSESWVAKVNGAAVAPAEFDQQYGQLARLYRQQGADLDGLFQARLRQMAMDQLVQRELVNQEAARQGIAVTDEDVSVAIKSLPGFQTNGQFDIDLYKNIVTGSYGSPAKFETQMRRDLAYQKMLALVRETARVSDDEVKSAWTSENDKVNLEIARFPLSQARLDAKPTDAQVQDFAARNGARVEQFYKENAARFDKKKRVRARHILAKVDEKAPQAAQDAARKKIEDLAARVKAGEDFGKLAEQYSDDPSAKGRGGDLGFFGQGLMAKPFEDAAFKLKAGELSGPVRTQFGWHLVKVEAVQEPEVVSLDKARPEIAKELLEGDLAKQAARKLAEDVLARLRAGKSFAEALPAAEAKKGPAPVKLGGQIVKAEETGPFSAGSSPNVPRVGPAPELFADALAGSTGVVLGKVYDTAAGPVVARIKERQRPDAAKFAEKKGEMETQLRLRREAELERGWVDALRKKAKVETNAAFVRGDVRPGQFEQD
jgi:peptidyl-prolyl cis-trans isomerase D